MGLDEFNELVVGDRVYYTVPLDTAREYAVRSIFTVEEICEDERIVKGWREREKVDKRIIKIALPSGYYTWHSDWSELQKIH